MTNANGAQTGDRNYPHANPTAFRNVQMMVAAAALVMPIAGDGGDGDGAASVDNHGVGHGQTANVQTQQP